jgi:hypothetical protein
MKKSRMRGKIKLLMLIVRFKMLTLKSNHVKLTHKSRRLATTISNVKYSTVVIINFLDFIVFLVVFWEIFSRKVVPKKRPIR